MRMIIAMILWVGTANTAFAHTEDGPLFGALVHQLFGSHHLLFTVALVALVFYLGRLWHRRDRA